MLTTDLQSFETLDDFEDYINLEYSFNRKLISFVNTTDEYSNHKYSFIMVFEKF